MKKLQLLILLLGGIILLSACTSNDNYKDITTTELSKMISNKDSDIQYVDIRTRLEYLESHIKEFSINIDFYKFENDKTLLDELDKNKPVVIICRTGNRTSEAMSIFKDLKYSKVYNVVGGIEQWKSENRPVI